MRHYRFIILLLLLVGCALPVAACTSVIITGKATADGRPLMWKNRDTPDPQSYVAFFPGKRYSFIGLVNSSARDASSVWMGTNSAGLCIMNTLSYNLIEKRKGERTSSDNGRIMRRALEMCGSVRDFVQMLDTLHGWQIESNFGVIDAQGGAAYFEVSHHSYRMYDVNDVSVAPQGYLVRTNYSLSGIENKGAGYLRYRQADLLMSQGVKQNAVSAEWLFEKLSRSFANPLTGVDLSDSRYDPNNGTGWAIEQNFIARRTSSCAVVFEGVRQGEKPEQTIMWLAIGYPPVCPALPLWVKGADTKLPRLVTLDASLHTSPLCLRCAKLHDEVYAPLFGIDSEIYLHWSKLSNSAHTGYMQKAIDTERHLFQYAQPLIDSWRKKNSLPVKEVHKLYEWLDGEIN
jgi:hypothetical protein